MLCRGIASHIEGVIEEGLQKGRGHIEGVIEEGLQKGRGHIEGVIEGSSQKGRGGAQPLSAKPKAAREARGARRRRAGCAPVPAAFAGRGRRGGPEKMQGVGPAVCANFAEK